MFKILPGNLRDLHATDAGVCKEHFDSFISEIKDDRTSEQETQRKDIVSSNDVGLHVMHHHDLSARLKRVKRK